MLVDVLDELEEEEVLVDAVVLCWVERLLVLVVEAWELVVGAPLAVATKARHAARRMEWVFMVGDCRKGRK